MTASIAAPSVAARLLALALMAVGLATVPLTRPAPLLLALGLVLAIVAIVRPAPRRIARRGLPALLGIGALALPLAASDPARGATVALRALLAVTAVLTIAETIPLTRVGPALSALGLPPALSNVVATLLRQLGSLLDEGRRLALARRLRGAGGVGVSTEMMAGLLARSAARAERVELAMRLRGYDEAHRLPGTALRLADTPLLTLAAAAAVALHLAALG